MASGSAVHRSLLAERILLNIFDHVHADGDDDGSVYNLAITCRAFQEPAMDVLWRVQMSLVPLVKCLPTDLWEETLEVEPTSMQVEGDSEEVEILTRMVRQISNVPVCLTLMSFCLAPAIETTSSGI
jgi:hypothetical protein